MNINDIARIAGVSKGTVSRVINNSKTGVSEATRERILQIIDEVGYIPNRMAGSLSYSRTKTIGLIIPDIQNMFFPQLVRGAEDRANQNGYTLFLCNSDSDTGKEELYLKAFVEKRVDGILLNTCGNLQDRSLLKSVRKSEIPIVLLDRKSNDFPDCPGIFVNNREAAYTGVSHLIRTGCRDILFLGGPQEVFTSMERLKGYRDALREAGIPYHPRYVKYGQYSSEFGYNGMMELLQQVPEADAVFTASDTIAVGAIRALHERKLRIPEDISVVGFDNIMFSADLSPALTTVAQPIYKIGCRAVELLIDCMNGSAVSTEYMKTELILRDSTRKIL